MKYGISKSDAETRRVMAIGWFISHYIYHSFGFNDNKFFNAIETE